MLAGQAELEAELAVACAHHYWTVLLWEVSHTGIEAQVAIVPQRLSQPQELKPSHRAGLVRRGSRAAQRKQPLEGRQAELTSFLETFSCSDLSCRCCSLVTRIHPRSMSDTVYGEDRALSQRYRKCLTLSSLTPNPTFEEPLWSEPLTIIGCWVRYPANILGTSPMEKSHERSFPGRGKTSVVFRGRVLKHLQAHLSIKQVQANPVLHDIIIIGRVPVTVKPRGGKG